MMVATCMQHSYNWVKNYSLMSISTVLDIPESAHLLQKWRSAWFKVLSWTQHRTLSWQRSYTQWRQETVSSNCRW